MTMALNGLAKLSEELGELQQVVGKMLAYGIGDHPDGKGNLLERFEEEAAEVHAAINFVVETHSANYETIFNRSVKKLKKLMSINDDLDIGFYLHKEIQEYLSKPEKQPLTDDELERIAVEDEFLLYCSQDDFNEISRAIEHHHGITK
jgi:NTP pyrophosphatase (non-canonical NTP hydrolase)